MADKGIEVLVTFPAEIPTEAQGPSLMLLELTLRTLTKTDVRVVKNLMGDDSRLRKLMTIKERSAL